MFFSLFGLFIFVNPTYIYKIFGVIFEDPDDSDARQVHGSERYLVKKN